MPLRSHRAGSGEQDPKRELLSSAAPGKSAPRVAVPPLPAARVRYRLLLGQLGLVCLHLGPQGKSAPSRARGRALRAWPARPRSPPPQTSDPRGRALRTRQRPLACPRVRYRVLPGQLGLLRLHLRLKRLQVLPLCCLFSLADFQLLSAFLEVLLQPGLLAKQDILALGGVEQVLQVKEQAPARDRATLSTGLVARPHRLSPADTA